MGAAISNANMVKFIATANLLSSSNSGQKGWLVFGYRAVARIQSIRRAARKFGVKLCVVRPFGCNHWSVWVSTLTAAPAPAAAVAPAKTPSPAPASIFKPSPAPAPVVLGFSGSRSMWPSTANTASFVISSAVTQPRWSSFAVGCCPTGLDAHVRKSPFFPKGKLSVFKAASRKPSDLVKRSSQLARSVGALVAFPKYACPGGLVPSSSSTKCFCGKGSGTWATAALAAGLGAAVYIAGVIPASLPLSWGSWRRSVSLPGCWRLVPHSTQQLSLF